MKIREMKYTKKDGETTVRAVMPLTSKETYEDCIDFGHLSATEAREAMDIQMKYEIAMAPYLKKAFRRFSKDGIEVIQEDSFKAEDMIEKAMEKVLEKNS